MADNPMIEKLDQISQRGRDHLPTRPGPELPPAEKAEQLWGLFNEYSVFRRGLYRQELRDQREKGRSLKTPITQEERDAMLKNVGQNPLAQRLEGEISRLWEEPQVKSKFVARVKESLAERKTYGPAIRQYQELKRGSTDLEEEYFDLLRNQFLMRQMTPTLRAMDISRNRIEKASSDKEIESLEVSGGMDSKARETRGGLDQEHADIAALLAFERIVGYHQQFKKDGVIFTPSREKLMDRVLTKTADGTWMQLIGETGTGKSTFAKRASWILNGEPAQTASGEESGDVRQLIGSPTADFNKRTYYNFGPLVVALTGCQNSIEMEEAIKSGTETSGKLLLLDELNKFDQDALFGALKIAANLRPGEIFNFKELPGVKLRMARRGVAIVATMNPATVRYERKDLDIAIDRLFYDGKEKVDYPPMTPQSPELYEIFLAILMDDNSRIRVAKSELTPAFTQKKDPATNITKSELDQDPKKHGALYRFALAASELHKSFDQKESVAKTPTDDGFLEKTVLEMQVLTKWIAGYKTEIEGGDSLTTYLEKKMNDFYGKIESSNDQTIFKRVFAHFGFDIETPRSIPKPEYDPLKPVEMGYLTPRTPRAVKREGEEATPQSRLHIVPSTGEEIYYLPKEMEIAADKVLHTGDLVAHEGKNYRYLGIDPQTQDTIFIPAE